MSINQQVRKVNAVYAEELSLTTPNSHRVFIMKILTSFYQTKSTNSIKLGDLTIRYINKSKSQLIKVILLAALTLVAPQASYAQVAVDCAAGSDCTGADIDESSLTLAAQELRNRDQTEEMLVLLGAQDQVNLYLYNIRKVYESKFEGVETTPEVSSLVIQHRNDLFELLGGLLSWDAQKEIYIDAYQEHLTEEETSEIVSFLKTPAGKKSLSSQKSVQASVNQHNSEQLKLLSPKIESITNELKRQIQDIVAQAKSASSN